MKLGTQVGLGPGHIVLDGDPAPQGAQPQFSAHVRCGQTTGWINMPLGMEVGLGAGDIVLDGDPAPLPQKGKKKVYLYSAFIVATTLKALRRGSHSFTCK